MLTITDSLTLEIIDLALVEDGVGADYTTLWTVQEDARAEAVLTSREEGILCGADLFRETFRRVDPETRVEFPREDGERIRPGETVARIEGLSRPLLSAERVALNFLGRLSGIATLTWKFVQEVEGTSARICDTRKTLPLFRKWEKYAVKTGGGTNHRFNLSDRVLLKDNHVELAGGVIAALKKVKQSNRIDIPVEIEVDTLEQLGQVLEEGVERILLDNMSLEQMTQAVRMTAGRAELEASGGVCLERVRDIALTGVDYISVGALTHSVKNFDFSLEIA